MIMSFAIFALLVGGGVAYWKYFRKDCVNPNLPKIYGDAVIGFKFNYPSKTVLQDMPIGKEKTFDSVTMFKLPITEGTNLKEKWLKLTVFNDVCEKALKEIKEKVSFGGVDFYKYENEEQTNSAKYETQEYSVDKDGKCLNFEFGMRSGTVIRGQGTPTFDKTKESIMFVAIIKTVRLIK